MADPMAELTPTYLLSGAVALITFLAKLAHGNLVDKLHEEREANIQRDRLLQEQAVKLGRLEERNEAHDSRFDELNKRVEGLGQKVDARFNELAGVLSSMNAKLAAIEANQMGKRQ
jgi:hypothetical protein